MISILPKPAQVIERPGRLRASLPLTVTGGPGTQATLGYWCVLLGENVRPVPDPPAQLRLDLDGSLAHELGDEGYTLEISETGIHLCAPWAAGLYYGLQSLRQLLPASLAAGENGAAPQGTVVTLPCLSIRDKPRYTWRGFMLDEARHFFGQATVMRILDWMALLKLNRFHWHLTDYQGWRVEIERYPRLTEIGGRRAGTQTGSFFPRRAEIDDTPYEGWYTQRQIREIVTYAAARHITIVPELDLPGHFSAALAAYPELGCTKEPAEVRQRWGIFPDVACVGNSQTLAFLRNVLDEICRLFPGRYIHLGGDEVMTERWQDCPYCRRLKQRHGYADWADLNMHVMNVLAAHLRRREKQALVWNEALRPSLSKDVVVMHWRPGRGSMRRTKQALRDGYSVVFQTWLESYFDYPHAMVPLKGVYRAQSLDDVSPSMAAHVLGVQGALWTEFVEEETRLQFNVFPRLAAKAEVGWSQRHRPPTRQRYADFLERWQALQPHAEAMGLTGYAPLEVCDPGPARRMVRMLRDIPGGDLQAEQRRWLAREGRET